ncbi:heavy metal-associated domain-containing protein [Marivirga harenae]|uniref:heavy-metal-associated domain-containing protein n=1 Tax=Marivirga harenae TaxID=2010992 RepID=UPI0026DF78A2|nr:heavy metal-associated domain-containing protein [Marivirga harenae]WKV10717.1 heavy metal-associated domain-containing protein [Marivirga harenae]|tara:strand:+ start:96177 stop:96377 length:201 start_codon:yes stop_codon:yes gene_type:complete
MESLLVKNVKCGGCADAIKNGLGELEGVEVKSIDISTGKLEYSSNGNTPISTVKEKLDILGYPVNE